MKTLKFYLGVWREGGGVVPTPSHSWGSLPKSWKHLFCGIGPTTDLRSRFNEKKVNFKIILLLPLSKLQLKNVFVKKLITIPSILFTKAHIHPIGGNSLSWLFLIYEYFKTWPKGGAPKIMLSWRFRGSAITTNNQAVQEFYIKERFQKYLFDKREATSNQS